MERLVIYIRENEKIALKKLADHELRDPRAQAVLIIREELQRRGLLTALFENPPSTHENQSTTGDKKFD